MIRSGFSSGRWTVAATALWFCAIFCVAAAGSGKTEARDAFVLISGGDSPTENNYSQYLQAKAVSKFFVQAYPTNAVWIFFGAGNVEGGKPVFSDVYRQVKKDGLTLD